METLRLNKTELDVAVSRVSSFLDRGGVVAVPTDTVYGLAADILCAPAVRKIFRMKERTHAKALPVFVRDVTMAGEYAYVDDKVARLLTELWPGQTTVVLRKRDLTPDLATGGSKTVGLRIPDHPFLASLLAIAPHPLVGTSANLSGSEPAASAEEVERTFARHIPRPDLIVDAGSLPPSPSSTVLDLTDPENPRILRMGAATKDQLHEVLRAWSVPRRQSLHAF